MQQKKSLVTVVLTLGIILVLAGVVSANVPAPPVNQTIGFADTIFNNLLEADCRICHDDPDITGPTPNVDRHHLLYGSPLPQGECSVNSNACLSDADCDAGICSKPPAESCTIDTDCDDAGLGETCGEVCIGETVAPFLDADGDGVDDTLYSCLSCHAQDNSGGVISFLVERDCLQCHIQIAGEASVHHLTTTAQGPAPLGDPAVGDCTPCHGTVVDDIGDGHTIPTYNPSLVTPAPSEDPAAPGGCNYCHDAGTDTLSGVVVFSNEDNHHNTGVFRSQTGGTNQDTCTWCHDFAIPSAEQIRVCEGCHGPDSLHNIQADSPNANNIGTLVVGGEDAGYGHVGRDAGPGDSDCWGCHGFAMSSAYGAGPGVPSISTSDTAVVLAGTDAQITLTGAAFSSILGTTLYISDVLLTDAYGSRTYLAPDDVTEGDLTVTIPGTTEPGNYTLQAVKDGEASNPVSLSIKPEVVITEIECSKCLSTMTITGSGFSIKPDGTDEDLYVIEGEGGRFLKVISWTDTEIKVLDARCKGDVTVNALFGSATW
jgi:hypothetical protein